MSLLSIGALLLLFTAYQLWGTGITQARSQARLRAELGRELPRGALGESSAIALHFAPRRPSAFVPRLASRVATPGPGNPVGSIDIPSIGLDMVIVQGVSAPQLALGPGHYPGTPLPGEAGNVAIAGHRTTYRHPFYELTAVVPGAPIVITTPQGVFTYVAEGRSVVLPTDVAVVATSSLTPRLTLTTCNPRYSAATRLVLHAVLAASTLFGSSPNRGSAQGAAASGSGHRGNPVHGRRRITGSTDLAAGIGIPGLVRPAAWGLALLAVAALTGLVARRVRRGRWALYGAGALGCLVVLFFFFGALSPLVPASY